MRDLTLSTPELGWRLSLRLETSGCGTPLINMDTLEFEGGSNPVSRRTFQNDLALMRSDRLGYNAPIVVRENKYYEYEDPDYRMVLKTLVDGGYSYESGAIDGHNQIFLQK